MWLTWHPHSLAAGLPACLAARQLYMLFMPPVLKSSPQIRWQEQHL
jgi:hypothetical protein